MSLVSNSRIAPFALASYRHPAAGNTERYLTLEPMAAAGPTLSSYQGLKNYAIRDFGVGFSAAEAILAHIVRNKLGREPQIPQDFWRRLVVLPIRCILRSAQTGATFDTSSTTSVTGLHPEFAASEGPLRVGEAENYAVQMRAGSELAPPALRHGRGAEPLGQQRSAFLHLHDGRRQAPHSCCVEPAA